MRFLRTLLNIANKKSNIELSLYKITNVPYIFNRNVSTTTRRQEHNKSLHCRLFANVLLRKRINFYPFNLVP